MVLMVEAQKQMANARAESIESCKYRHRVIGGIKRKMTTAIEMDMSRILVSN